MSNDRPVAENNRIVKKLLDRHKITERLGEATSKVDQCKEDITDQLKLQCEWLDEDMDNIRKHASSKCRKILIP